MNQNQTAVYNFIVQHFSPEGYARLAGRDGNFAFKFPSYTAFKIYQMQTISTLGPAVVNFALDMAALIEAGILRARDWTNFQQFISDGFYYLDGKMVLMIF